MVLGQQGQKQQNLQNLQNLQILQNGVLHPQQLFCPENRAKYTNFFLQFLLGPKVYGLFVSSQKTTSWFLHFTVMDLIRILLISYKLYFIVNKLYIVLTADKNTTHENNNNNNSFTDQPFFKEKPWWKYLWFGRWGTMLLVSGIFSWVCCLGSMYLHNEINHQQQIKQSSTKSTTNQNCPSTSYQDFLTNIRNPTFSFLLFLTFIVINGSFFFLLDASNTFDNTARNIQKSSQQSNKISIGDFVIEDFMILFTLLLLCLPFLYNYFKEQPLKKMGGMILLLMSIVLPFLYTLYVRVACFSGKWNVVESIIEYFMENLPEFLILIYFSFYFSFSFELYETVDSIIKGRERIQKWFAKYGLLLFLLFITVAMISIRRYLDQKQIKKIIINVATISVYLLCAGFVAFKKYRCGIFSECISPNRQQYRQ